MESYKLEKDTLSREVNALLQAKKSIEEDCARLKAFIHQVPQEPSTINVDEKLFSYYTFRLNAARHASYHTMMKYAKQEYLRALRDYWDNGRKEILDSTHAVSHAISYLTKIKEQFHEDMVNAITARAAHADADQLLIDRRGTAPNNDRTEEALPPRGSSIAIETVLGKANIFNAMERERKEKDPVLVAMEEDKALAQLRVGEEAAALAAQVRHSSALLHSFNDEVREKMKAVQQLALDAVRRKYGTRADLGPSPQLTALHRLQSRVQQLESLTASFLRQQESLRQSLAARQDQSTAQITALSALRRERFLATLKEHYAKTEQILIAKRRIKRHANTPTSQPASSASRPTNR